MQIKEVDKPFPNITINQSDNRLITTEAGESTTFDVRLASQPSDDVRLSISSSDSSEGEVSVSSLTFTAANWNSFQTVIVTGQDDAITDTDISYSVNVSIATSNDADYLNLSPINISFTNPDNDTAPPDILVSNISGTTSEDGDTATLTIRLLGDLTDNVVVELASSDRSEGIVSPPSLTFTPTNSNELQVVTARGRNDDEVDGDMIYTIKTSVADGSDQNFINLNPVDVEVINIDNDGGGGNDLIIADDFEAPINR